MSIWKRELCLESLNESSKNTLIEHLGIIYTQVSENSLSATMPVAPITHQPLGMLHGGASVVLAESLGSLAANFCCDLDSYCVGLEINANHIKAVRSGVVTGVATPVHLGRSTQLWSIEIKDQSGALVCIARHTVMVRQGGKKKGNL